MLDGELEVVQAPSLHAPEEIELVSYIRQGGRIHVHLFVGHCQSRNVVCPPFQEVGYQTNHESIGNEANDDSNRNGKETKHNGNSPEWTILVLVGDLESISTHENDQYLTTTHKGADTDKEPVLGKSFENVELVVQATVADELVSMVT